MLRVLFLNVFILLNVSLLAQSDLTQSIKGQVIEKSTELPLIGANVFIVDSSPLIGTNTDENGYYRFENVPVGRYQIACSYVGYQNALSRSTLVTSGKELIQNFELVEELYNIDIKITSISEGKESNIETMPVSIQSFDSQVASRYAGSRSDVSRMAAGFAGVMANDDSRNDIIIRGNSPSGLLWRMNDIDIPNPSHFGALGATGGPVSMLNNNLLANSSFITSAFPASYGNALSGVFDLSLRKGNHDKTEGLFGINFNGFEGGLEGPLGTKGGSYLINYRYSVIDLVDKIIGGVSNGTGTGAAIPRYQDLSFNINLPTTKYGTFSMIGLSGTSGIDFLSEIESSDDPNLFTDSNENLYYKSAMQIYGITNKHYFNNHSFGKLILSYSRSSVNTEIDTVSKTLIATPLYRDDSEQERMSIAYRYKNKLNKKNAIHLGATINRLDFNFLDSLRTLNKGFEILRDYTGQAALAQSYAMWNYKPAAKWTINTGLYYQEYSFNNTRSLEPRFNLKYKFSPKLNFSIGIGQHSKLQDYQLYLVQTKLENGSYIETNNDLEMTKSNQVVLGLNYGISNNWTFKTEVYYQNLSNVPVELTPSSFSALNLGANFNVPSQDSLTNNGSGKNIGAEFTLDRSFSNGFYLLSTLSIFDSKYKGSDNILRSTAFDNGYVGNILTGKEFEINEKYSIALDTKLTVAGGRKYTPINLEASILEGEAVYDERSSFSSQHDDYFRTDFKITIRENKKRYSQSMSFDLQNITNRENVFGIAYDASNREIDTNYQLGFYLVVDYKLTF